MAHRAQLTSTHSIATPRETNGLVLSLLIRVFTSRARSPNPKPACSDSVNTVNNNSLWIEATGLLPRLWLWVAAGTSADGFSGDYKIWADSRTWT